MNKAIAFAQKGQHLEILSVTATEKVEGYIYVEAFKEAHVKKAIKGFNFILGGKCQMGQREEMTGLYRSNKQEEI